MGKVLKIFKNSDKKAKFIVILGLLGIFLIFISQFQVSGEKEIAVTEDTCSSEEYKNLLEEELEKFISDIKGAGKTRVLITLKGSGETKFLKESKSEFSDTQKRFEESYVLTDGKEGRNTVIESRTDPEIKGVLVICEGADSVYVKKEVLNAVTTALDIGANRVYISKRGKD